MRGQGTRSPSCGPALLARRFQVTDRLYWEDEVNLASWPLAGKSIASCKLGSHAPRTSFLSRLWDELQPAPSSHICAQNTDTGPADVSVSEGGRGSVRDS